METGADLGTFKADKLLLERAIMNVIGNASDYSPLKGTIYVEVQKPNLKYALRYGTLYYGQPYEAA